jgi:hypothetical protein
VMQTHKQSNIRNFHLTTNRFDGVADVHFTPLSSETGRGVIMMFQVARQKNVAPKEKVQRPHARSGKSKKKSSRKRK